jgi:hypothetical protein
MKKILLTLMFGFFWVSPAFAQNMSYICQANSTDPTKGCTPVTAANPLAVTMGKNTSLGYIPMAFGAKCDGKNITVSTTSGSAVISTTNVFTQADVGKLITIPGAAAVVVTGNTHSNTTLDTLSTTQPRFVGQSVSGSGIPANTTVANIPTTSSVTLSAASGTTLTGTNITFGYPLNATILSVDASGNATLSVAPTISLTGVVATYGTDDTAVFQNLSANVIPASGYGSIVLPVAICVGSNHILWYSNESIYGQGAGKSVLKYISLNDMTDAFISGQGTLGTPLVNAEFYNFEMDGSAATQATFNVSGKGINISYGQNIRIENVTAHDFPATQLATDYGVKAFKVNNTMYNCGRLGAKQIGSSCIGDGVKNIATVPNQSMVSTGNHCVNPSNYCVFLEAQDSNTDPVNYIMSNNTCQQSLDPGSNTNGAACFGETGGLGTIIQGNSATCTNLPGLYAGITVGSGTGAAAAGAETIIDGNTVRGCYRGVSVDYINPPQPTSTLAKIKISNNELVGEGSTGSNTSDGIYIRPNTTTGIKGVSIIGNTISQFGRCGFLHSSGTAVGYDFVLNDNNIFDNSQSNATAVFQTGVCFNSPVNNLTMVGNHIYDSGGGTQKYGISFNTNGTITNGLISSNNLIGNATSAFNFVGTFTGSIVNNPGYNPLGASTVTPGASPWTYTAGNTPETLYIYGGTVSTVVKNSITLATASPASVTLQPGESVVITYTVAPTAATNKQ